MRVEVERVEGIPSMGRTVKRWNFYLRVEVGGSAAVLILDRYIRGTIPPGKRKLDVEVGYSRLDPRSFPGGRRLERDDLVIPKDVREEALATARNLIRFEA